MLFFGIASIKIGDTLYIAGKDITNATVSGDAYSTDFGVWRVQEIGANNDYVVFVATQDANPSGSISGFSITAPDAVLGLTNWTTLGEGNIGYTGSVIGPVGTKQ